MSKPTPIKIGNKVIHSRLGATGKVVGVTNGARGEFIEVQTSKGPRRYRRAELSKA